ncbi:MAG TPA: zf-HC2 domain-containing protein [Gemmatimonadaceae bacterium]|nr:zf-HC2 domain-containing protein [Gemmatimonadaceae bacterium]
MAEHPSSEEVAAYLGNGLAADARHALEAHIAECRTCRTEISSARRLLASGRSRQWQWIVPTAVAAAAAIAFFPTSSSWRAREEPTRAANRASSGSAVNLGIVSPSGQASVTGIPVFTWRADGSEALYRFSITDAGGGLIWLAETQDTIISLPADVSLDANREYLWNVDAVDPEGGTISTGTHRFRISR